MKAFVEYDVCGTVANMTIEGPYIRIQMFKKGRLLVTVFDRADGVNTRSVTFRKAHWVDLDRAS